MTFGNIPAMALHRCFMLFIQRSVDLLQHVDDHAVAGRLDIGDGIDHLDPIRQGLGNLGAILVVLFQLLQGFTDSALNLRITFQISLDDAAETVEFAFYLSFGQFQAGAHEHFAISDLESLFGQLHRRRGESHGIVNDAAESLEDPMKRLARQIHPKDDKW